MLSYSDFENMDLRIDNIISQEVSVVVDKSEFPPTTEDLEDNNKTYSLDAAVLFIDIRCSTKMHLMLKSEHIHGERTKRLPS